MLLGVTFQNKAFSPKRLVHQTPLKYEKELFDQVKKLKTNFFDVLFWCAKHTQYLIYVFA